MKKITIRGAVLGLLAGAAIEAPAQLFDPSELVAYWKFEDESYTAAADSIGANLAVVNDQEPAGPPSSAPRRDFAVTLTVYRVIGLREVSEST